MDQPNYPLTGTKLTDPKKYWPGQVAQTLLGLLRFSDVRNHLLTEQLQTIILSPNNPCF